MSKGRHNGYRKYHRRKKSRTRKPDSDHTSKEFHFATITKTVVIVSNGQERHFRYTIRVKRS